MSEDTSAPPAANAAAIEQLTDTLYELLRARALSIGLMDIEVEAAGWLVEGELLFTSGPDFGFSLDLRTGTCRYCELVEEVGERWCEPPLTGLQLATSPDEAQLHELSLAVLNGVLDARRPLLRAPQ